MSSSLETSDGSLDAIVDQLQRSGVRQVLGTMVNASGLLLAKSVPLARLEAFQTAGMGTAPVWDVFTVDGGIAFTDAITAVGDRRLRIDPSRLRVIGPGQAWAPANVCTQDGEIAPTCSRGILDRVDQQLAEAGLAAQVGHELEFVLVGPDGAVLSSPAWTPYGVTGLLDQAAFVDDLLATADTAGLPLEQFHAEYGRDQFELSLPPTAPVAAADQAVLARILVGAVSRRHGVRASFSPAPFPGSVGNGAHQHLSLTRHGVPLLSGGDGPHGITGEGGSAIGGIIGGLAELQGFLTGSVLSGCRLAPGTWSGAYACWGLENREASLRLVAAGRGNPHGAHLEVKIIDPSANVYLASAAILALALDGIASSTALPDEVGADPGGLSDEEREQAGIRVLSADPARIVDALAASELAQRLLGAEPVAQTVAVRRLEQQTYAGLEVDEIAERLRLAWSA